MTKEAKRCENKSVDMKDGMMPKTYRYLRLVRFPIVSGMVPLNWLEYNQLKRR